ncbi:hypothetical protein L9F63_001332, partial [Diploptera punctata]
MSKDIGQDTKFRREFRKVYYFSKIAGIAPFSNYDRKIDTSSNMRFVWPVMMFAAMLTGSIYTLIRAFRPKFSAINAFTYMFVLPSNLLSSTVIIFMLNTFKRNDFMKLMVNVLNLDADVPTPNVQKGTWSFLKKCITYIVICVHIGFPLLEIWFWRSQTSIYYEAVIRVSDMFHMLLMLIFNSMTNIIKIKLQNILDKFSKHSTNQVDDTLKKPLDFARISIVSISEGIHIKDIRNIRKECCMAYSLSVEINSVFGFTMLFIIIKNSIYLVYNIYSIYTSLTCSPGKPLCFLYRYALRKSIAYFWIVHIPLSLFLVTKSCDSVFVKFNSLVDRVQQWLLDDNILRIHDFRQLRLFANQLQQNKIEFNAVGINLNLKFFCTFMASVCTYTIVLIQ